MRPVSSMKPALTQLILESAYRANILPLTSICNVRCVFCSHRQNPPGIEIYQLPPRQPEEIRTTLDFIDPNKKIVIGESVTRITEGEPFTHPEIRTILELIRERFPATTVQVTTNGTLLDRSMTEFLARMAPVELNLSLNSRCAENRTALMRDQKARQAVNAAGLLKEFGIPYHGSIVAMPHLTGWADLAETILYLAGQAARTVRIFLPGYTGLAPAEIRTEPGLWAELTAFVAEMRRQVDVPLTIEPQRVSDLSAVVTGIMAGSPVARAGIKPGDVIISIRGKAVYCRVDAFQKLRQSGGKVLLELVRGGEAFFTTVEKQPGASSGLVMDYDIDPGLPRAIGRVMNSARCSSGVLMTSLLAEGVLRNICPDISTDGVTEVLPVPSRFFGGNIMAAGLLTVADFAAAWADRAHRAAAVGASLAGEADEPDILLLPAAAFDARGRDLTGRSYDELADLAGIRVAIC